MKKDVMMKIVFLSNYFNHHQQPISEALFRLPGVEYHFIATMPMPAQRKQLGYHMAELPEYVCSAWNSQEERAYGMKLLAAADVVIAGSAPEHMFRFCIKQNKLLFRYSERPLKKGLEVWRYPVRFLRWHYRNPFWKPIYMLCASAYTAPDYRKFGLFKNKTYKWGYFPETKRYEDPLGMIAAKDPAEILWCGRFLDWKHPEDVLIVARILKTEGYSFRIKFVGAGVLAEKLKQLTREYDLEDCVSFLGQMTPEQVRTHMEKAGIYLFTSDRQEGWGAVLNESMNSGCAVIAGHAAGSVPYLMEDGKNGLIYESGNVQALCDKVRYLLERPDEQKRLGAAAYHTITEIWNAESAAGRLIQLAECLLADGKVDALFETGPCSRAG